MQNKEKARMATVQTKLDELIKAVEEVTIRLDNLDGKFDSLSERLNKLEHKYIELEEAVETKLAGVKERLRKLEKFQIDAEKAALMQDSYNKRLNILFHGVEENERSVWENHEETLQKFENFLTKALDINPDNVEIADIHCLPQKPVIRQGAKVTRPIIVKLSNAMDKAQIFSNLNRLKTFNETCKKEGKGTVYVTEHLPKQFIPQKKLLLPIFKRAKANKKKTSWRVENGEYALYVDNKKGEL